MLKKTITCKDFNGNTITKDLYFHLSQTETVEFSFELPENLTESVQDKAEINEEEAALIIEKIGRKGVFDFVKTLVLKSYGIKSPDGLRFEKSEEISKEFSQTAAFDALFMELMSDDKSAYEFITGVLPPELLSKMPAANAMQSLPGTN